MGLFSWIVFGALAGWLSYKFAGSGHRIGVLRTTALGIAGALIGGFLYRTTWNAGFDLGFNPSSLAVAVIGAAALLVGGRFLQRQRYSVTPVRSIDRTSR